MWTVTQAFLLAWLNWLASRGVSSPGQGPLYNLYLGLYQYGSPPVGQFTTLANIVEASFPGYARMQVVWYPVFQSTGGAVILEGGSLYFAPSSTGSGQNIAGVFACTVPTGVNGQLYLGQNFTNVLTIANPLTVVKVLPNITLSYQPVYGGCVVES